MPLRRRGKIFQAQSQGCRDCYWTNPWRDPLHFIDVNGRRRRKRAVEFSIVFQTLRQKDRGKRQSVLSKYFYRDSSCLLVEFICILNDEESSMSLQTTLSAISSFVWGPPLLILLSGTGLYLTLRLGFLQIRYLPRALSYFICSWCE